MTTSLLMRNSYSPLDRPKKESKEPSQFMYWLIYNRMPILLFAILLVITFTTIFAAECALTWESFGNLDDANDMKIGGSLGLLIDYGGWVDDIFSGGKAEKYKDLLSINISGGTFTIGGQTLSGLGSVLTNVNNMFKLIAWGLALIFWGYSYAEMLMMSNGQMIVEQMIKKLVVIVVAYFVIENSLTICCAIVDAGTELANVAIGSINDATIGAITPFKKELFDKCYVPENMLAGIMDFSFISTFLNAIPHIIVMIIPWFVTIICDLIIQVLCWSRAIEICLFAAISPIMFIDLGTTRELTHSSTARALKNLVSLSIQGALILISLAICQSIMSGIMTGTTMTYAEKMWKIVLICILQVGTIGKTQSVAKQALGV